MGTTKGQGDVFRINLESHQPVKHVMIQEDISKGEHVLEYNIYGLEDENWKLLSQGTSIGHKRIENIFDGKYTGVKLEIVKSEDKPKIRSFECY